MQFSRIVRFKRNRQPAYLESSSSSSVTESRDFNGVGGADGGGCSSILTPGASNEGDANTDSDNATSSSVLIQKVSDVSDSSVPQS